MFWYFFNQLVPASVPLEFLFILDAKRVVGISICLHFSPVYNGIFLVWDSSGKGKRNIQWFRIITILAHNDIFSEWDSWEGTLNYIEFVSILLRKTDEKQKKKMILGSCLYGESRILPGTERSHGRESQADKTHKIIEKQEFLRACPIPIVCVRKEGSKKAI